MKCRNQMHLCVRSWLLSSLFSHPQTRTTADGRRESVREMLACLLVRMRWDAHCSDAACSQPIQTATFFTPSPLQADGEHCTAAAAVSFPFVAPSMPLFWRAFLLSLSSSARSLAVFQSSVLRIHPLIATQQTSIYASFAAAPDKTQTIGAAPGFATLDCETGKATVSNRSALAYNAVLRPPANLTAIIA